MLNGTLQLHDIQDVEAFCTTLIPHTWHTQLTPHDREDLTTWLIETCWELSLTYQPGHIRFSTWAGNTLRKRTHDWLRQRNGRTIWKFKTHTYTRPKPVVISTDTEHGRALAESTSHLPPDRHTDLGRLLRDRDRHATRDHQTLGLPTPRRAA